MFVVAGEPLARVTASNKRRGAPFNLVSDGHRRRGEVVGDLGEGTFDLRLHGGHLVGPQWGVNGNGAGTRCPGSVVSSPGSQLSGGDPAPAEAADRRAETGEEQAAPDQAGGLGPGAGKATVAPRRRCRRRSFG